MVKKALLSLGMSVTLCSNVFAASTALGQKPDINPKDYVNVLTWWGYLDDPRISQEVKNQCGVNLSYDEYYTNEEFANIFAKQKNHYDLIIFSNLMYGSVKEQVANNNSDLYKVADNYYPYFKNYYFSHGYPHNVVFFTHAMMGFMYNPEVMNVTPNENIFDIFKSIGNNYVVIVDDPAEVRNLLTLGYNTSGQKWPADIYDQDGMVKLNYQNFSRITQNSNVFVTNDFNQIYKLPNFAMSFMWSGDALLFIQQSNKPYKFMLDPKLSYVCTDLLAELKPSPQASCVAHVLESPKVMSIVENESYYFSPYFQDTVNDPNFHAIYQETKQMLPGLSWIQPVPNFKKYDQQWEAVKLKINAKDNH